MRRWAGSDVGSGRGRRASLSLPSRRVGALLALSLFVQVTSGCLSNEYRIPHDELARLAQAPAATRGQRVHVVQGLGDRRSDPVTYHAPPPPPPPEVVATVPTDEALARRDPLTGADSSSEADEGEGSDVRINLNIDGSNRSGSGSGSRSMPRGGGSFRGDGLRGTPPGGGLRGTPPSTSWRGTPPAGGGHGVGAPTGTGGGRMGGGGHIGIGGGGGGGGGGDGGALAVLAVVLVAVAVIAAVSLVASEGMRFDGYAEMAPDQSIHLKNQHGATATVALAALTLDDLASTVEATVKDDEDYGLGLRNRAPLDRTGLAFKLEFGSSSFNRGPQQIAGMASQIQVGAFFTRSVGVMLDIGLSGGSVCCAGILSRHSLALEAQAFPWSVGRLHIGGFAKGGVAIAGDDLATESGPIVGGGALVELALTTRLALTFRAAANTAHLDSGWSTAGALTGGVAVY